MNQGHGRHETRELYAFEVTPEQTGFPHTTMAAVRVSTTHHLKELRVSQDAEILLSSRNSKAMSPPQFEAFRRSHWGVENFLHYVRDVSFGEDWCTAHKGHTPENMTILRNLVIGICAIDGAKQKKRSSSVPAFRGKANNDRDLCVNYVARSLLDGS